MSQVTRVRVRARRNKHGTVLEWHPADEDDAKRLLWKPHFAVTLLYRAVDRSRVSDSQVVATLKVLPESHRVDSIEVPISRDALSLSEMQSLRENIEEVCHGEAVHA